MKIKILIIFFFIACINTVYTQSENIKWEPLVINSTLRVWYNVISVDTNKGEVLNVWILQTHRPPLEFKEINHKVYRTKTEYCINFKYGKYGIKKAVYYGAKNNLLYNFDYHLENYPDSLKYTYPVKDNFFINLLTQKIESKGTEEK